jgi:hypothetical protein
MLHIAGMIKSSEAIPEPATLGALADDPARESAIIFVVHVEV